MVLHYARVLASVGSTGFQMWCVPVVVYRYMVHACTYMSEKPSTVLAVERVLYTNVDMLPGSLVCGCVEPVLYLIYGGLDVLLLQLSLCCLLRCDPAVP